MGCGNILPCSEQSLPHACDAPGRNRSIRLPRTLPPAECAREERWGARSALCSSRRAQRASSSSAQARAAAPRAPAGGRSSSSTSRAARSAAIRPSVCLRRSGHARSRAGPRQPSIGQGGGRATQSRVGYEAGASSKTSLGRLGSCSGFASHVSPSQCNQLQRRAGLAASQSLSWNTPSALQQVCSAAMGGLQLPCPRTPPGDTQQGASGARLVATSCSRALSTCRAGQEELYSNCLCRDHHHAAAALLASKLCVTQSAARLLWVAVPQLRPGIRRRCHSQRKAG